MYTAEKILATSHKVRLTTQKEACLAAGHSWAMRRDPETVFGTVMSNAEVDAALSKRDPDLLISATGLCCVSDRKVFFLTDDSALGHGVLPKSFIAMSLGLPARVAPRPAVPDGIIKTAAEFIAVFHPDERQINTIDELVDYLNTGNLPAVQPVKAAARYRLMRRIDNGVWEAVQADGQSELPPGDVILSEAELQETVAMFMHRGIMANENHQGNPVFMTAMADEKTHKIDHRLYMSFEEVAQSTESAPSAPSVQSVQSAPPAQTAETTETA